MGKRWEGKYGPKGGYLFFHRYTGLSNRAIGELFGGIHDSTVSKVTARLRAEMVKDKELSKLTNRLYSHFKA
jgi:chromosomal replication initiation ATPase DnaA